jgi:hypothetical protein
VTIGEGGIMLGDVGCRPIRIANGSILLPVQIRAGLTAGLDVYDVAVLIGTWNAANTLDWTISARLVGTPAVSTRGWVEPTLMEMPDGRILMIVRGSNKNKTSLPSYKWYSISSDGGLTWSPLAPWGYTDGTTFYSPSSMSRLIKHSNGKYYWLGNVVPTNANGNAPRYPLVIGQVDPVSLRLIKSSLVTIDDLRPEDPTTLQLSNFHTLEDRVTGQLVVYMSPFGRDPVNPWTCPAYAYRIDMN